MSSFNDPESMNRISSAQKIKRFVPIDEVPDENPDPSEVLILKETPPDEEVEPEAEEDINDIERAPSYLSKKFNAEVQPPFSANGNHSPELSPENDLIVDEIEKKVAQNSALIDSRWDSVKKYRSDGKHGNKPEYKDKILEK